MTRMNRFMWVDEMNVGKKGGQVIFAVNYEAAVLRSVTRARLFRQSQQ